jgi:hypothetical protein
MFIRIAFRPSYIARAMPFHFRDRSTWNAIANQKVAVLKKSEGGRWDVSFHSGWNKTFQGGSLEGVGELLRRSGETLAKAATQVTFAEAVTSLFQ